MAAHIPDPGLIESLPNSINQLSLFDSVTDSSHEILFDYSSIGSQSLIDMVHVYTHNYSLTKKITFEFLSPNLLLRGTWTTHNTKFHEWEKTSISPKRIKRNAHKHPNVPKHRAF
ncbi:unnamed protein product [Rhizophagus irregularis]|uniref:Uncharacterized protein n=1 Tax=Rhizophagus irregularis TaxID=588596 RepID=A0A2N1NBB5_9GLOM|nr:hypothetical protein RhiirC2_778720 [Rhizophagus irregularis]CAB4382073.1 unnamed protein product [Rhizophagus irregularis]CAB5352316.1 unnamed protein product [Rhizophagus irregularis]